MKTKLAPNIVSQRRKQAQKVLEKALRRSGRVKKKGLDVYQSVILDLQERCLHETTRITSAQYEGSTEVCLDCGKKL